MAPVATQRHRQHSHGAMQSLLVDGLGGLGVAGLGVGGLFFFSTILVGFSCFFIFFFKSTW